MPSTKAGWKLRPPVPEDLESYVAMIEKRSEALGTPQRMTRAGWEEWWATRQPRLAQDMRVAEAEGGRIVGAGGIEPPAEPFVVLPVWASVHPDFWSDGDLWDALYVWVRERASSYITQAPENAQVNLLAEASEVDGQRRAALLRAGFTLSRVFFRMALLFDAETEPVCAPSGVMIRPIDPDLDLLDVARVHNEAFRDHWGHADQSPQAFAEEWRRETAGHRTDLGLVAQAGGAIVGYLLCEDNYGGDSTLALIAYLGVLPERRQRGIARALLATAFRDLQHQGYKGARLGVDASSPTGALDLYEKVGMRAVEQINRYDKVLRPGIDRRSRV